MSFGIATALSQGHVSILAVVIEPILEILLSLGLGAIMGWLLNMLMVNVLGISVFVSTVVVGILVVIGNYVFSKLLVFRSKKPEENP